MNTDTHGNEAKNSEQQRLAVLIDADNAQAAIIRDILDEIAKYGTASVKRIYGDWTQPQANSWKKVLLEYSIQPIQQFRYTVGKNATDSALIIDAMDLLYTKRFDGFCLVSSDSDFTRLASRLREEGLSVYGFGEKKTPKPFVSACDKFIYVEILGTVTPGEETQAEPEGKTKVAVDKKNKELIKLIAKAIDTEAGEDDWANLGSVGSTIMKMRPDFDPRLYGHTKLSNLVKSLNKHFTIDTTSSSFRIRNKQI